LNNFHVFSYISFVKVETLSKEMKILAKKKEKKFNKKINLLSVLKLLDPDP